jgi:2-oxoglutarate ferredoxin oxidoreductase subunit alpha
MVRNSVSIALIGSGGAGVMTAGQILLDAAAKYGLYGLMGRSLGPQIRGGESAALLRLSTTPVQSPDDVYDILLAVDWGNIDRFASELPLSSNSLILHDPANGDVPDILCAAQPQQLAVPFAALAKSVPSGRVNMVALGVVAAAIGLPNTAIADRLHHMLAKKGDAALAASLAGVACGRQYTTDAKSSALAAIPQLSPTPSTATPDEKWSITGNEAAGLGILEGGVRFSAAYPITPATDILEWLAPNLEKTGGTLVQAEDELASITMCLGGSFGGTPSMTATSGPGLALMTEAIGLGVASEVPVVIVNVMRGGPSTGIPTKSEQSDLNIAVYGLHGDAPHLVLAPNSISDCHFTCYWAVQLAEALQCPTIVLSDQAIGQSRAIIHATDPATLPARTPRVVSTAPGDAYQRYAITDCGVSPMALPGTAQGAYVADGLEHAPNGRPSTRADHHQQQLDKRTRKLTDYDYQTHWADIHGAPAEIVLLTWGSVTSQVLEAQRRLHARGVAVRVVSVRLISPARPTHMADALAGAKHVIVIEQNHMGQFYHFFKAHYAVAADVMVSAYHRAGPLAIRPHEIETLILEKTQ